MLSVVYPTAPRTIIRTAPATSAVVSWNTRAPAGHIDLAAYCADGALSDWLPYVAFDTGERRSLCGKDAAARIETDIVRTASPVTALEVRSDVALDMLAVSTPVYGSAAPPIVYAPSLDVRPISQYVPEHPNQTGWCSPAAVAMLLAYWGTTASVTDLVSDVYDTAYGGTGNWTFNTAAAARYGLRAAVVHLAGLEHAATFTASGIPLAISIAWKKGELPGAPLPSSAGHLIVLRGFPSANIAHVNDPAHPELATMYLCEDLDRIWRAHGGVAYAVVPPERMQDVLALANA
jgi:hypothetical protein